jgi:hypothetical protein
MPALVAAVVMVGLGGMGTSTLMVLGVTVRTAALVVRVVMVVLVGMA